MAADEPPPPDRLWTVAALARRWSVTPGAAWGRVLAGVLPGLWLGTEAGKPSMSCPKIGPRYFRFRPEVVLAWEEEQATGGGPGMGPLARLVLLESGWDGVVRGGSRRGGPGSTPRPGARGVPSPACGPPPEDRLWTVLDLAARWSMPSSSARLRAQAGGLPGVRFGPRTVLYRPESVAAWERRQEVRLGAKVEPPVSTSGWDGVHRGGRKRR